MQSDPERIAILEEKVEQVEKNQEVTLAKLDTLLVTMTKYKGFMGGVMFAMSAVATAIGMVVTYWFGKPS